MTARFLRAAENEMVAAARYYEHKSFNLGRRFLAEVERTLKAIMAFPDSGTPMGGGIIRRLLRTFPFALLYVNSSEELTVIAVMDLRRSPDYWKGRA